MLQYGTVEPRTLDVLKKLLALPELNDFYLVGGTALALYYGHRKSVDLDPQRPHNPQRTNVGICEKENKQEG